MTPRRTRSLAISLVLSVAAGGIAHATVTQVDGSIIPVDIPDNTDVQDFLIFEGEDNLDAILDAAELPEVFLPNTTEPVRFINIAEEASFENTFGWYNVGDDVSSEEGRRENLHPIIGCGSPMEEHDYVPDGNHDDHHHGRRAHYLQDSEPTDDPRDVAVDFALEEADGRYKGGFIAFYLITPEGSENGTDDCGDFVDENESPGIVDNFFGRIYFTQKDLNNDGDFVHHLVYNSRNEPDRFYFGFEDLFRGGDNDFDDAFIGVDGLTPPCIPTPEICGDNIDNDCDGLVDGDDDDVVGVGEPCLCDNGDLTCADGNVFGVCQDGLTVCQDGEIQCESVVEPSEEICDGLDNDCNNQIDDDTVDSGDPCDGVDADLCEDGEIVCQGGVLVCNDDLASTPEICNGIDDDCDGLTDGEDDDLIGVGDSCGTDVGECSPGVTVCVGGDIVCEGEIPGSPEICDGLDNDCDGLTDAEDGDLGGVGGPCGTDVGECSPGVEVCSNGVIVCTGQVGPTPEICDGLDNDCDGQEDNDPVDVGEVCIEPGLCTPGVVVCVNGAPECQGGETGSVEVCNGIDDDCNGIIDDNPVDAGGPCGTGMCGAGVLECINGALECVGSSDGTTETCNGIDDDCDGEIDEGDLCEGGECVDGQCSLPCADSEFPCPPGQICVDDFCVADPCDDIECPDSEDGGRNVCVEGLCEPICDTVPTCPGDRVCRPSDGLCVPDNCHYLPTCGEGEICRDAACVTDPCVDTICDQGEFCRDGDCVASCADVTCGAGDECRDGVCEATGCPSGCAEGLVCNGNACIPDPCAGRRCQAGQACEPWTGACVADPCNGVSCPADQVCRFGQCLSSTPVTPEPEAERVTAAGGGCSVASGTDAPAGWLLLAVAALLLSLRRRRQLARALATGAALLGLLGLGACNVNPFCLNCEQGGTEPDGGAGGGEIDAMAPSDLCDMGIVQPEVCDGEDNDCDGEIDEDFDLQTDIENCGACGVSCLLTGARTECTQGQCMLIECFPGFIDLDGDPDNGCEYACFTSNGGVEACDGLDNDCDGEIDEDIDLSTNENCGACGVVCSRFQASATCVSGVCSFDPDTDCNTGFHDIDGNPDNGCEYACSPSNGGVEACDFLDNDCDGEIDEDTDLDGDPQNCGTCGRTCSFFNASAACVSGQCEIGACAPGFHDLNGQAIDGCEYACTISNGGVERCDGRDNDCNGIVDDDPADAGGACNAAPGGTPVGACTNTGTMICSLGELVCTGAPEPQIEVCNGVDDDCDGAVDEDESGSPITRACYTGPDGTLGIGLCRSGVESCVNGSFDGTCVGDVVPAAEICDGDDNDCDGAVDEDEAGDPLVAVCYSGTPGTENRGICTTGTQICALGAFGNCEGEVVDAPTDFCGDGLDNDCDDLDEEAEGCAQLQPGELRLDGNGGNFSTDPGEAHSFDVALATGGTPAGTRVYAVWSDLNGGPSSVYFRRSLDGGVTWETIENLSESLGDPAVKPVIVVSPNTAPGGEDHVYVVFQSTEGGVRDLYVVHSGDSGASFSDPEDPLDEPDEPDQDAFHHHAAVSADGATLSVVWENLLVNPATREITREIFGRVITNSGGTLEPAPARRISVNSGAAPVAGRPQTGITAGGRFVYAWREARDGDTMDVFATYSDSASDDIDPGAETRLDGDTGDTRNSDFPQMIVVGDNVYVTWQDISTQPGGGSDVVFVRSTSGAGSFEAEQVIDDPDLEVSSSFTPAMAVDGRSAVSSDDDRVFIAWEDRRQGTQVFAAASLDGGASFEPAVRASSATSEPIPGLTRSPRIAFAGGDMVAIAYINAVDSAPERIFVTTSIDAGLSWQLTHEQVNTGAGQALAPAVVGVAGGGLTLGSLVSWIDFRAGSGINGDPFARRIGR